MIAVDTSALVAIILGEPDAEQLARIMQDNSIVVSAAGLFEASMVLESRQGPDGVRDLRTLLNAYHAQVVDVDREGAEVAHEAWRRYGKGRHSAGLNFGDCFSYALAKDRAIPLLFKGDDFSQTDVTPAI